MQEDKDLTIHKTKEGYKMIFSKLRNMLRSKYIIFFLCLIIGVFLGYLIGINATSISENLYLSDKGLANTDIATSIDLGIKNKVIYIDDFHSKGPANLAFFSKLGMKAYSFRDNFFINKDNLFQSGLLIMRYEPGINTLSRREKYIIKQYIANGGRVFILCPSWVWVAIEKKPLKNLPHYIIAKYFDVNINESNVAEPLKIAQNSFVSSIDIQNRLKVSFSNVRSTNNGIPILIGNNGDAGALGVIKGKSKAIIWGQNNLFVDKFSLAQDGNKLITELLNWLFKKQ